MDTDHFAYWTTREVEHLTADEVQRELEVIQDDLFVAALCADKFVDNVEAQRAFLCSGLQRTHAAVDRSRGAAKFSSLLKVAKECETDDAAGTNSDLLASYFRASPRDAKLCALRALLLQRLDRLNTFVEICDLSSEKSDEDSKEQAEWEDPWVEVAAVDPEPLYEKKSEGAATFTLSIFLTEDLLCASQRLIALCWFTGLQRLLLRHGPSLWPHRVTILESIPEYVKPSKYRMLFLPFDLSQDKELEPMPHPWRIEVDWTEMVDVQSILVELEIAGNNSSLCSLSTQNLCHTSLLTGNQLSAWYKNRAEAILECTGIVGNALEIVQHGAAQGISGLDEFGEDLTLLSRLVYDTRQDSGSNIQHDWTLSRWRSLDSVAVVRAYLLCSSPASLPDDITSLVMPYLFVLESRAERAGKPDPQLPTRLLYDYILTSPLDMVAPVFQSSKPTLSSSQRIIRDDEDMVRLALSCLYGDSSLDQWSTMSQIFECLPAWELTSGEDQDDEVIDSTMGSLAACLAPSTQSPRCTPVDLFNFFNPLSRNSLSKLLDILDAHLESGEILARWGVSTPLHWFLRSNRNISQQRAWANKMTRLASMANNHLDTLEEWTSLLDDMLKLTGVEDTDTSSAFGLLRQEEVNEIFFAGLLSTGKFDIAQCLLTTRNSLLTLNSMRVEEICLSCSREFYDNAHVGNYKIGDMKLAYDCLRVSPPTERILKEKEFIEATSRISSFNIMSRPGVPLSPLEIRLTKDRLTLISWVLSSNSDAYKHIEVILNLLHKLGFQDDAAAEIKVLGMLSDAALRTEDFDRAYEFNERLLKTTLQLLATPSHLHEDEIAQVREVCWVACFQLGRHPEFTDTRKRLALLGHTLKLCSPDRLHDVLSSWKSVEKEDIAAREQRLSRDQCHYDVAGFQSMTSANITSSLRARLKEIHMPSPPLLNTPDAAILASRTFKNVAASFPFSVGQRSNWSDSLDDRSNPSQSTGDVSVQASRVLSKGIGWLIGSDDNA